ncbi:hypothetical protein Pelo_7960 [Pelomyxa schiedti]|nr:hypothetical protein Pelo_7960 [Pelomyxa schiedti]
MGTHGNCAKFPFAGRRCRFDALAPQPSTAHKPEPPPPSPSSSTSQTPTLATTTSGHNNQGRRSRAEARAVSPYTKQLRALCTTPTLRTLASAYKKHQHQQQQAQPQPHSRSRSSSASNPGAAPSPADSQPTSLSPSSPSFPEAYLWAQVAAEVRFLVACGARADTTATKPALLCVVAADDSKAGLAALLCECYGAEYVRRAATHSGRCTALHVAAASRSWATLKILLSWGADVGAVNRKMQTALDLAIMGDWREGAWEMLCATPPTMMVPADYMSAFVSCTVRRDSRYKHAMWDWFYGIARKSWSQSFSEILTFCGSFHRRLGCRSPARNLPSFLVVEIADLLLANSCPRIPSPKLFNWLRTQVELDKGCAENVARILYAVRGYLLNNDLTNQSAESYLRLVLSISSPTFSCFRLQTCCTRCFTALIMCIYTRCHTPQHINLIAEIFRTMLSDTHSEIVTLPLLEEIAPFVNPQCFTAPPWGFHYCKSENRLHLFSELIFGAHALSDAMKSPTKHDQAVQFAQMWLNPTTPKEMQSRTTENLRDLLRRTLGIIVPWY